MPPLKLSTVAPSVCSWMPMLPRALPCAHVRQLHAADIDAVQERGHQALGVDHRAQRAAAAARRAKAACFTIDRDVAAAHHRGITTTLPASQPHPHVVGRRRRSVPPVAFSTRYALASGVALEKPAPWVGTEASSDSRSPGRPGPSIGDRVAALPTTRMSGSDCRCSRCLAPVARPGWSRVARLKLSSSRRAPGRAGHGQVDRHRRGARSRPCHRSTW